MQTYVNREEGGLCHFKRAPTNVWKAYPDLQKEKGIQKWARIVVKGEKRSGTVRKDIELKGRAAKFHKSSLTFWAKTFLQPRNKQKSAAVTHSMDITDFGITSVSL